MKKINYYSLILSLAFLGAFSSCTTTKFGAHFQPSTNSSSSYAIKEVDNKALALEKEHRDAAIENAEARSGAENVSTDALPKVVSLKKLITDVKPIDKLDISQQQQEILAETKERLQNMSRKEKRQLRREVRKIKLSEYTKDLPFLGEKEIQQDVRTEVNILALIFAILVPPLGVFIDQGVNEKFWISLLLTVLGITSFLFIPALGLLPAIAYSVLVVLGIV